MRVIYIYSTFSRSSVDDIEAEVNVTSFPSFTIHARQQDPVPVVSAILRV